MIPKFRAWVTEFDAMYSPENISNIDFYNESVKFIGFSKDCDGELYEENFDVVIGNAILMQSTNLFDKNGVEIFEGDIVKLQYTITSDFEFFRVTRSRGGAWRIDNSRRRSGLWLRNEGCEVIGNIYENPELIESVEE
ncbi:YopX family protein [Streptococcus phocae subsp. salmonis]|uniref:YopX family protein n=1 Tax=Streptococcus phocae TaxID=119224 RepID=UPI000530CF97|nr:YopX family protein [Streptococcus phocae]KGR72879.1 hypothetical protein NX86_03890 [Streptococcus phocae subsp. salmonis]QBX27829.1 hypothetical protein Javan420_0029 [Streptococcus phage Javan420]